MFAAIDIGTNTVLLLIAKYEGQKIEVIHEEQRIPRLGKGVDRDRNLSTEAMDRVVEALRDYRRIIDHYYPQVESTIVAATSAVRDASNKKEFVNRIEQQTGFDVRILTGQEEAQWTYLGARSMLTDGIARQAVTLDIGGGSSEVSLGREMELLDFHSFDIGSVRFTERFIHSDPPTPSEIEHCREAIAKAFDERPFSWKGDTDAVGVAGTVTSLAYMEEGLTAYDPELLAGVKLSRGQVSKWVHNIGEMTTSELLQQYPEVMEGRADVFLPGIMILEEFLKKYGFNECIVSTGGIRHGAVVSRNAM